MDTTSRNGRESGGEPANGESIRLVLFAAAETEFARDGRLVGDLDLPLTERGREVSKERAAEFLEPDGDLQAVYSSPNQGARETAAILANGSRVKVIPELRGVALGLWEGQRREDVKHRHTRIYHSWCKDPVCISPPGGEEMTDAFLRTNTAVRTILKRHKRGSVAVVASETVIALLLCHLQGMTANRVFEVGRGLGPVEVVSINGGVTV
jgi:broad specificity phosphatase PhoE